MFRILKRKKLPRHLCTGAGGEAAAVRYLHRRGYRVLERNFRCRLGEIDIIAEKRGVLVFLEVRTRRDGSMVDPLQSVDGRKIARIVNAARFYLMQRRATEVHCRFDVLGITDGRWLRTVHVRGAFDLEEEMVRDGRASLIRSLRNRFPGRANRG